jgi:arginine/lysine/ornithine decarboxylase
MQPLTQYPRSIASPGEGTIRQRSYSAARGRHLAAPLLSAIANYQRPGTVAFSTPGHKGGAGADDELRALLGEQVFAADVWLNMGDLHDALQDAEDLAADAWGAETAHFLVNGSSSGNHALLQSQLGPGDEVIVARDTHRSLIAGLVATGACPVFVAPRLHDARDIGLGSDPVDVAAALDAHPGAKMVVVTSPTYHGVVSDVAAIARLAHGRGIPLYVDQAWGAHLRFHPSLPPSAIDAGADAVVISPHKTLSALSQGAILLVKGPRIDRERLCGAVRMTQTTSRNLPILASLDAARRQVAMQGWASMERCLSLAARVRAGLRAIPGIEIVDAAALGLPDRAFDPTRIVIDTTGTGIDGFTVERLLRSDAAIAPEMSDAMGIICLITPGDSRERVDRLVSAIADLADVHGATRRHPARRCGSTGKAVAPGEQALTPREAYFAPSRAVPLPAAVGEISAELVVPYPPGIPVLMPGERITLDKLLYLAELSRRGGYCTGAADPRLLTIRVVARG